MSIDTYSLSFRHPCTTTEMTRLGVMAVGYGCGTIRMFDPTVKFINGDAEDQLSMTVQISAHARCITSMSAAKDADLLLSVSEDSWIRVWKISSTVIIMNTIILKIPASYYFTITGGYISILLHERRYYVCGMPIHQ